MARFFITLVALWIGFVPAVAGAADVDSPDIINWARPSPIGPAVPFDPAEFAPYALDRTGPTSLVYGLAVAKFKDGTAAGCFGHGEEVDIIPSTPYSRWIVQNYAAIARRSKHYPGALDLAVKVPPQLSWHPETTVVRHAECGQTRGAGYIRANLPVGSYMFLGTVSKSVSDSNFTINHTYGPGPGGIGWYSSSSGGAYQQPTDTYIVYSAITIDKPGETIEVPFYVIAHYPTPY